MSNRRKNTLLVMPSPPSLSDIAPAGGGVGPMAGQRKGEIVRVGLALPSTYPGHLKKPGKQKLAAGFKAGGKVTVSVVRESPGSGDVPAEVDVTEPSKSTLHRRRVQEQKAGRAALHQPGKR